MSGALPVVNDDVVDRHRMAGDVLDAVDRHGDERCRRQWQLRRDGDRPVPGAMVKVAASGEPADSTTVSVQIVVGLTGSLNVIRTEPFTPTPVCRRPARRT